LVSVFKKSEYGAREMTESVPLSSRSRFCSRTGARTTYWASASRVLVAVAGIRMLASTLKPLWVQASMFFASRSFRSLRSRK
jgi:hypothetical protein